MWLTACSGNIALFHGTAWRGVIAPSDLTALRGESALNNETVVNEGTAHIKGRARSGKTAHKAEKCSDAHEEKTAGKLTGGHSIQDAFIAQSSRLVNL